MLKMRNTDPQGHIKAGHDKAFKPAKVVKEPVKAAYNHMSDLDDKKKNFRNEDGEVVIGPRNFLTNPLRVGQTGPGTAFGRDKYIEDKYDGIKELEHKERLAHEAKLQDKPFSQRAKHTAMFNTYRQVMEEDPII